MAEPTSNSFADFVESLRYPTGAARGSEWLASEAVSFPAGIEDKLNLFATAYERRGRRLFGIASKPVAKAPLLLLTDVTRARELYVLDWLVNRLALRRYSFDPREFRSKTPQEISETIAPLYESHAAIVHITGVDGVPWAWTSRALEARTPEICVIATSTAGAQLDATTLAAFGTRISWTENDDGRAGSRSGAFSPHP